MNRHEFIETILNSDLNQWTNNVNFNIIVFNDNLDISISEDRNSDNENMPFNEPWATDHFCDKNALRTVYLVKYGQNIVDVVYCAIVDGGRAIIPYPNANTNNISEYHYKIGQIINENSQMYEEALRLSGLTII